MAKSYKIITKASVYLKRAGNNLGDSFEVSEDNDLIIDSSNFYRLIQGQNKLNFQADDQDLSGKGFMSMHSSLDLLDTFSILEYPIKSLDEGVFNLWLRYKSPITQWDVDISIDGVNINTIIEPSVSVFSWVNIPIVFPDTKKHILGIKMKEKGNSIDKIYITKGSTIPINKGPDITESPFITIHMQVFKADPVDLVPTEPLFIYDYKNTIDEVKTDDWYNFNTKVLDDRIIEHFNTSDRFSLVLTTTGSNFNNFIIWELVDNDEYLATPSVIKG